MARYRSGRSSLHHVPGYPRGDVAAFPLRSLLLALLETRGFFPSLRRLPTAFLLSLLAVLLTFSDLRADQYTYLRLSKSDVGTCQATPGQATAFTNDDTQAVLWGQLDRDPQPNDLITISWVAPNGYTQQNTYSWPTAPTGCILSKMLIRDHSPAQSNGSGWVDVHLNGQQVGHVDFTITSPLPPPPLPSPPTNLTASVSSTSVDLNWSPVAGVTGYIVDRKTANSDYAGYQNIAANVTKYSDQGAPLGVTTCFRVRALNQTGSSTPSNEACTVRLAYATLQTPSDHATLTTGTVAFAWLPVTAAESYELRVGSSCADASVADPTTASTSLTLQSLPNGTLYWRVIAKTSQYGGSASVSECRTLTVQAVPPPTVDAPTAEFTWTPQFPATGSTTAFGDLSQNAGTWRWNFGDGSPTDSSKNAVHTFAKAGAYNVILTVSNSAGESAKSHSVTVGDPPTAVSFGVDQPHPIAGAPISFTGTATGAVDVWTWDFGDHTNGNGQVVSHTFSSVGDYVVRLVVKNKFGETAASAHIVVSAKGCANCSHLHGRLTVGGAAIRSDAMITVTVAGVGTYAAQVSEGAYAVDVPQSGYTLHAELTYADSVTGSGNRVAKIATLIGTTAGDNVYDIAFPPPVVLLHGIRSQPSKWRSWADGLNALEPSIVVIAPAYDTTSSYDAESNAVAGFLRSQLSLITKTLPSLRVIAHSKGGVVIRVVIGDNPDIGAAVKDIIELGTPNRGTACIVDALQHDALLPQWHLATDEVKASIGSQSKYSGFGSGRAIHAIAGTENLIQESSFGFSLDVPCPDSCEANDGWVPISSVFSYDTPQGNLSISGFAVPYHHEELGSDATRWLLDVVIIPYYAGQRQFTSCEADGVCAATWCAAGRGVAPDGTCNVIFSSGPIVTVRWKAPSPYVIGDRLPHSVTVERGSGTPSCQNNSRHSPSALIIGYRIFKSFDATFKTGAQRVGFIGPDQSTFIDLGDQPVYAYGVAVVYFGNQQSEIVPAAAVGRRHATVP
jgi:PKD repeat protein